MTYNVIIMPKARNDLVSIYSYISYALKEETYAWRQIERIIKKVRSLDEYPNRNPKFVVKGVVDRDIRRTNVDRYTVIYEVDEKQKNINVLRVLYSGRDLKRLFNSSED